MNPISCPACSEQTWLPWRRPAHGPEFVRCARCDLARIEPMPTRQDLAHTFDDGYFNDGGSLGGYVDYDADAAIHRVNAEARMNRIDRRRDVPRRPVQPILVDVGCASGYTLEAARDRGWQAVGVEVSPGVAQRAREKGFRVEADLEALLRGPDSLAGSVAVVAFFQVLEHVPDPARALQLAYELLAPGGRVICETWDPDSAVARASADRWQQLSPSVLWVFNQKSMSRLLSDHQLVLDRWAASTKWVSVALVAGQVLPKLSSAGGPVRSAAERALTLLGRVRLPYGLGDLVTVDAVRRS